MFHVNAEVILLSSLINLFHYIADNCEEYFYQLLVVLVSHFPGKYQLLNLQV